MERSTGMSFGAYNGKLTEPTRHGKGYSEVGFWETRSSLGSGWDLDLTRSHDGATSRLSACLIKSNSYCI